jgi:hypothetical protein
LGRADRLLLSAALVAMLGLTALACEDALEGNLPPEIVSGVSMTTGTVRTGETMELRVLEARDPDGDQIAFQWEAERGTIEPAGPTMESLAKYTAPPEPGEDTIIVVASDGRGGKATVYVMVMVVSETEPTSTPAPTPFAEITSPSDGARVYHETRVSGDFRNLSQDQDIWVMVQPHLSPQFHPQENAVKTADGQWFADAYFGEQPSSNVGERFELIIVAATQETSQAFLDYLAEAKETGSFPGLAFLPEGATILDQITVERQ